MPTTTSIDNKQVIERYVAALAAGDADAVHDSSRRTRRGGWAATFRSRARGAAATRSWPTSSGAMAYYEPGSVSLEVTGMVAEGDQVTLEWTSRARTAAGEPYENFCIGVFTVRDGRIAAVREYMDTGYARRTAFAPRR